MFVNLFHLTFFCLIPLISTPFHPSPFYPILSHPILSHPILFHSILSHPIPSPSYPIPSHPILSHPIISSSLHPILPYPTLSYPILSYSNQSCPVSSRRLPFHPKSSQTIVIERNLMLNNKSFRNMPARGYQFHLLVFNSIYIEHEKIKFVSTSSK